MAGMIDNADPLEPTIKNLPKLREEPADGTAPSMFDAELDGYGVLPEDKGDTEDWGSAPTDGDVQGLIKNLEPLARDYFKNKASSRIAAAYRAIRNEHPQGSKYGTDAYKNRSRYFRPKTRQSLRKAQTAMANALFATSDVVKVTPGDESNPLHKANAALQQELLKYRLDRKSARNAIPWFKIAIGARTDAHITGYCAAKVYWDFRRKEVGQEPILRRDTGEPLLTAQGEQVMRPVFDILRDRPNVRLFPIEQVGIDPAASWENPAQDASFVYLMYPMYKNDIRVMMEGSDKSKIPWKPWKEVALSAFSGIRGADQDTKETRDARSAGVDRYDQEGGSRKSVGDNPLCWVYEWFFDWKGEDYCVWVCGNELISDPILTKDAYPEHNGMRPVVIGTDTIEPHEVYPLSQVSALQPVQQEINDHVNLRLDAGKMSIFPIAKIVRGRNIDAQQVHRRGPNASILVNEPDDVTFEVPPSNTANAFAETDRLNMDFDEIAGQFSSSSVQSNRKLNETVGGMQIMAGDAQATSNLDLRVWCETFAEPVLTMIVNLEQFYETDTNILALCGTKAELWKSYTGAIDDELLMSEVMTTVDIGIGASDPMAALQKMTMAWGAAQPIIQNDMNTGRVKTKPKEIITEIFGAAQFKDAGERFFEFNDQALADPAQLQQQIQQLTDENNKLKAGAEVKIQTAQIGAQTDIQVANIKEAAATQRELATTHMEINAGVHQSQLEAQRADQEFQRGVIGDAVAHERAKDLAGMKHEQGLAAKDRDTRNKIATAAAPKVMGFADPPSGAGPATGQGGGGGGAGIEQALSMIAQAIALQTQLLAQLVGGGEAPPPSAPPAMPPAGPMPPPGAMPPPGPPGVPPA